MIQAGIEGAWLVGKELEDLFAQARSNRVVEGNTPVVPSMVACPDDLAAPRGAARDAQSGARRFRARLEKHTHIRKLEALEKCFDEGDVQWMVERNEVAATSLSERSAIDLF